MRHALCVSRLGRAIVIGILLRLAVYATGLAVGTVPPFLAVIDTAAGLALAVGAVYVVVKLVALGKRHLLWRVRRKLMLSYVFVGVFPAALIAVFFLLCGFLLFYNFSSTSCRASEGGSRIRRFAQSTALEIHAKGRNIAGIIERRPANASGEFAGVSLAVVPAVRNCGAGAAAPETLPVQAVTAGSWAHVEPPTSIPAWIDCAGISGVEAYSSDHDNASSPRADILVRSVAFPASRRASFAVVVDLRCRTRSRHCSVLPTSR